MVDLDRLKSNANVSLTRLNDRTVKLVVDVVKPYPSIAYVINNEELEFLKGKTIKILCDRLTGSNNQRILQFMCTSPSGTLYINSGQSSNYVRVPDNATKVTIQFIVVNTNNICDVAVGDWATFEAPRIVLYDSDDQTWKPYGFSAIETSLALAEGDTYENGQITRTRKQVVFDGSSDESWFLSSSVNKRMIIGIVDAKASQKVKCNRFIASDVSTEKLYECYLDNNNNFYINSQFETIEEWKTWLQTHPVTIEYELETPTAEEFKIPTVPSYFPYTDVSTDNTLETDMTWKVLADCDNSLKQEALEKRIEALEMNALGE